MSSPSGPILFVTAGFLVDSENPIHILIDPIVVVNMWKVTRPLYITNTSPIGSYYEQVSQAHWNNSKYIKIYTKRLYIWGGTKGKFLAAQMPQSLAFSQKLEKWILQTAITLTWTNTDIDYWLCALIVTPHNNLWMPQEITGMYGTPVIWKIELNDEQVLNLPFLLKQFLKLELNNQPSSLIPWTSNLGIYCLKSWHFNTYSTCSTSSFRTWGWRQKEELAWKRRRMSILSSSHPIIDPAPFQASMSCQLVLRWNCYICSKVFLGCRTHLLELWSTSHHRRTGGSWRRWWDTWVGTPSLQTQVTSCVGVRRTMQRQWRLSLTCWLWAMAS